MTTRSLITTASILSLVLTFAVTAGPAPAVTIADLEGYWTFDNAGNLGADSGPNGNNLNSSGSPTALPGKFAGGMDLDGPGQNDVLTQGGPFPTGVPTGGASYAVSAWVNADPDIPSNGGFVGWGNYGNNSQVNAHRVAGANAYHHYWWSNDLTAGGLPDQYAGDPPAGWHHYVGQYDAGSQLQKIFVDGTLAATRNVAPPNVGAANFTVGKTVNNEYWNGRLDDVAIFSTVLSDGGATNVGQAAGGDIAFLFNAGVGNPVSSLFAGAAVPEPSTLALGLLALTGLGFATRRRRRRSSTRVSALALVGMMCLVSLGAPAYAGLVGQFTFEPGLELVDLQGNFPNVSLQGNASVSGGVLDVNGTGTNATGWAYTTGGNYTGPALTNKTLVSWLTLQGLENVADAGSALTLDRVGSDQFDGIIFAERQANRWMNGSNGFSRTMDFVPGFQETTTGDLIQLAITYQDLGGNNVQITGYRDGVVIGQYNDNPLGTWVAGDAEVIFGKRHGNPATSGPGALDALIEEARIYDMVLSQAEIQGLTLFGTSPAVPEPSTAALGLLALAGLGFATRRRRR